MTTPNAPDQPGSDVEADATWALREPSVWESPDGRSIPTLLAAIGQTLATSRRPEPTGPERLGGEELSEDERGDLEPWDNGADLCPSDAPRCTPECEPLHENLYGAVERIVAAHVAAERERIAQAIEAEAADLRAALADSSGRERTGGEGRG